MKEHRINADVVSFTTDGGIQTLAFAEKQEGERQPAYLLIQRAKTDRDVYVEVNDQINSGYNLISAMTTGRGELTMKVKPEFRNLGNPDSIRLTYAPTDQNTKVVDEGLRQIMKNGS